MISQLRLVTSVTSTCMDFSFTCFFLLEDNLIYFVSFRFNIKNQSIKVEQLTKIERLLRLGVSSKSIDDLTTKQATMQKYVKISYRSLKVCHNRWFFHQEIIKLSKNILLVSSQTALLAAKFVLFPALLTSKGHPWVFWSHKSVCNN